MEWHISAIKVILFIIISQSFKISILHGKELKYLIVLQQDKTEVELAEGQFKVFNIPVGHVLVGQVEDWLSALSQCGNTSAFFAHPVMIEAHSEGVANLSQSLCELFSIKEINFKLSDQDKKTRRSSHWLLNFY